MRFDQINQIRGLSRSLLTLFIKLILNHDVKYKNIFTANKLVFNPGSAEEMAALLLNNKVNAVLFYVNCPLLIFSTRLFLSMRTAGLNGIEVNYVGKVLCLWHPADLFPVETALFLPGNSCYYCQNT